MKILNSSVVWKVLIAIIGWTLIACVPFLVKNIFLLHIFNLIFMGSALGLSWAILARTGCVSFAHNAFLGIGAYTSVFLVMQIGVPFLIGFLAAGIIAGIFTLVIGIIVLRLKGIFFVLSTFCFAQIMLRVFRIAEPITGGLNGIRGIPKPTLPFIGLFESHAHFYFLFFLYTSVVLIFTVRLFSSSMGREFKAIGENIFAAESMGIDTFGRKVTAFVISSVLVGFGGSLHAHYSYFISDTTFETVKAIEIVVYNIVGGVGSIAGPIIGAAIMIPVPELLSGFVAYQIALYGFILILIVRFFPKGIWGGVKEVIYPRVYVEDLTRTKSLQLSSQLGQEFSMEFKANDNNNIKLLECSNISRSFSGLVALTNISFSVTKGEIIGIVGPNGAGKTTLFNTLTGVLPPNRGRIVFEGKEITHLRPYKRNQLGITRVFQNVEGLYITASVEENLSRALVAKMGFKGIKDLFGLEKEKHRRIVQRTQEIMRSFGLESVSREVAKNLPHGFQRLLELAMALIAEPKLLLLDEPVSGMSLEEMNVIAGLLEKLQQQGLTIIVVEHNVNFVMRLCSHIMVLDYGIKIAEGTPEEIQTNSEVIRAFLGG